MVRNSTSRWAAKRTVGESMAIDACNDTATSTLPKPIKKADPDPVLALRLGDEGGSGGGLVLEGRGHLLGLDVVSGQSVDSGLDENHSAAKSVMLWTSGTGSRCSQLGVLVGSVSLEVLSDGDGLLDEVVKVLGDGGAETCRSAPVPRSSQARHQNSPLVFKIRRILLPVTDLTWGTPCESRRMTPIWDGERPRRANLKIWSVTSSGVALDHDGWDRRYGRAEALMPFPLLCILACQLGHAEKVGLAATYRPILVVYTLVERW